MPNVKFTHSPFVISIASWFNGFAIGAIAIPIPFWGCWIFHAYPECDPVTANHEIIHAYQQEECGWIYWAYIGLHDLWISYWTYGRKWRQMYEMQRFEQEAYDHEIDMFYLETREPMAWQQYSLDPQDLQTEEL